MPRSLFRKCGNTMPKLLTESKGKSIAARLSTKEVEVVVETDDGQGIVIHMRQKKSFKGFEMQDEVLGTVRLSETDGTLQFFKGEK